MVYDDKYNRYVIKWCARAYSCTKDGPLMLIREIQVYTPHFFERYRERGLKDMSLSNNDVVYIYLSRNREGIPIIMNEAINRQLKKYGPGAKYGYRVRDGFCFALSDIQITRSEDGDRSKDKHEALYVVFKTFMNESNMRENQLLAIDYYWFDKFRVTVVKVLYIN